MKKTSGFTLIELIVVIVILGILAVTAAPKFIDLQSDSRVAVINGIKASLSSAVTLTHGKALATGVDQVDRGKSVKVSGKDVEVCYGYPCALKNNTQVSPYMGLGYLIDKPALSDCRSAPSTSDICERYVKVGSVFVIRIYNYKYYDSKRQESSEETYADDFCYVQYQQAVKVNDDIIAPVITVNTNDC